jgi:hypothetical protein
VLVHVLVLVLEICPNGVQSIVYNVILCYYSKWSQSFDHEKLDVYGLELQFVAWTTDFLQEVTQAPVSHRRELLDQLDRACISVLLKTAEGNGKRQGLQRARFFADARGSPRNVRRAWMPQWLNESQRAIASVLAKSCWLGWWQC